MLSEKLHGRPIQGLPVVFVLLFDFRLAAGGGGGDEGGGAAMNTFVTDISGRFESAVIRGTIMIAPTRVTCNISEIGKVSHFFVPFFAPPVSMRDSSNIFNLPVKNSLKQNI